VKVLLDECVDRRLARDIVGHDVRTARQMGWTTIKDRELLALATGKFDAFVTVDRNLSFQQNLALLPISVFVLHTKTNRLSDLRPLVPRLLAAIEKAPRGVAQIIDAV
jgi:predicted nuclease of predicted toxin-antitoxin system